jgi:hypothetical protein
VPLWWKCRQHQDQQQSSADRFGVVFGWGTFEEQITEAALLPLLLDLALQAGTESAQQAQLYTVLEQRKTSVVGGLLGTEHTYIMPDADTAAPGGKRKCVICTHH